MRLHSGRGVDTGMSANIMTGGTPLVPQGKAEGSSRGPRRVRLVEAWKVEDLVVPVKEDEEPGDEEHLTQEQVDMNRTNLSEGENDGEQVEKEEDAFWNQENGEVEEKGGTRAGYQTFTAKHQ